MEKYTLTAEVIEKANSYIPVMQKQEIAEKIATCCVDTEHLTYRDGDFSMPLPDRARENTAHKQQYLMSAMLCIYLKIEDSEDALDMNVVDKYGASHLFNQLDRFKSDSKLRDKVFDILYDYRALTAMVNAAIYSEISSRNDTASRLLVGMTQSTTPEHFQALLGELDEAKNALDEYQKNRANQRVSQE